MLGDTKTGKNFHQGEFEIQLAGYVGGEVYLGDPIDGVDQRLTFKEFTGLPVNQEVAYIVHVSVTGSPKPRIVKLDLDRGRRLALACVLVKQSRAELDGIGIGDKLDHRAVAQRALEEQLDLATGNFDEAMTYPPGEQAEAQELFRQRCRVLRTRFLPYWTDEMTEHVKERLNG